MNLRRDGLISRLYFGLVHATGDSWRIEHEMERGTDLCTVVRTIIGVPLAVLFTGALILASMAAIVAFAVILSVVLYETFHGVIGAALFAVSVVTLVVAWVKSDGASETREVAREWVRAKKGRYCPRVEFVDRAR